MASPTNVAGLISHLDAATLALTEGAAVASWADPAATGPAVQGTAAARPTFHLDVIGGRPIVRFNGTTQFLTAPGPNNPAATTVVAVVRPTGATGVRTIRGGDCQVAVAGTRPSTYRNSVGVVGQAVTTIGNTAFRVITFTYSDAENTWSWHIDGALDAAGTTAITFATATRQTAIGRASGAQNSEYLAGDLAALLTYNRAITAADRAEVHTWAQDEFGIPVADYAGPPKTTAVVDTFDEQLDPAVWVDVYNGAAAIDGQAVVPTTHNAGTPVFAGLATAGLYTLDDLFVEVFPQDGAPSGQCFTTVSIEHPTILGTRVTISLDGVTGLLQFADQAGYFDPGQTTVPYDPNEHAWWRIRRDIATGDLLWQTSTDATIWTTRRTEVGPPAWLDQPGQFVRLDAFRDTGPDSAARFDNVNTVALLWADQLDTGDLGVGFQTNNPGDYAPPQTTTIVPSPTEPDAFALRCGLVGPNGDGVQRAERVPRLADLRPGMAVWFGTRITLPVGFTVAPLGFQLATQWKNEGTGSPPIALHIEAGRWQLQGGFGYPGGERSLPTQDLGPAVPGERVDWVFFVEFETGPDAGTVSAWRDGVQVLDAVQPPGGTLYPRAEGDGPSSTWKIGAYRAGTIPADELFHEHMRAGLSRSAVEAPTVGADVELAGRADVAVTATGAPGRGRRIDAAAPAATSAAGTLAAARALAGRGAVAASATGALSRTRGLAGTAPVATAAGGALGRGRPLAGDATAAATAHAELGRTRALDGAAAAASSATGALVVAADGAFVGRNVTVANSANGALTVVRPLAAAAASTSRAVGALAVARPLGGLAATAATADGGFDGGKLLAGVVPATNTAAAAPLTVARALTGSAPTAALLLGEMLTARPLIGAAAVTSSAAGALDVDGNDDFAAAPAPIVTAAFGQLVVARGLSGVLPAAVSLAAVLNLPEPAPPLPDPLPPRSFGWRPTRPLATAAR